MFGPSGWVILLASLFVALLLIVLFSTITIKGTARRINHDDHIEMTARALFGLLRFEWKLPALDLKENAVELKRESDSRSLMDQNNEKITKDVDPETVMHSLYELRKLAAITEDLLRWLRFAASRIKLTEWRWNTAIGSGDAVWTAMSTGAAWSVKSAFLGLISQWIRLQTKPEVTIDPVYNRYYFATELQIKMNMRMGAAIAAIIFLLFQIVRVSGFRALFSSEIVRRTLKTMAT